MLDVQLRSVLVLFLERQQQKSLSSRDMKWQKEAKSPQPSDR